MTWIKDHTYKCDICGKIDQWGDTWSWWGSLLQQENVPVPTVCSKTCEAELDRRLKSGEIKVQGVKSRGYRIKITGERVGY